MRELELLKLKEVLETRLQYLDNATRFQSENMVEMNSLKLKESGDIISMNTQLRLDEAMLSRYHNEAKDIMISLKKFANKTYGICEMCDDEIDIERLKLKPHATYCIVCREIYEKNLKDKK